MLKSSLKRSLILESINRNRQGFYRPPSAAFIAAERGVKELQGALDMLQ